MLRRLVAGLGIAVAVLIGLEALARWPLGLGSPPLTIRDPEIEYLFAPSQDVWRFGNRVTYNEWSMRSEPILRHRVDPGEFRMLVIGDSVVNGGVLTDQRDLATSLVQEALRHSGQPAAVGNISAGSWGPENEFAYMRRFGWFDADLVVLVVSTHDMADAPTFPAELGPDFPLVRPPSALWEALARYVPRYLPLLAGQNTAGEGGVENGQAAVDRSVRALQELLRDARAHAPRIVVLHHPARDEQVGEADPWRKLLQVTVATAGVPLLPMAGRLGDAQHRAAFYRDGIHLSAAGHRLYAEVLLCLSRMASTGLEAQDCLLDPSGGRPSAEQQAIR